MHLELGENKEYYYISYLVYGQCGYSSIHPQLFGERVHRGVQVRMMYDLRPILAVLAVNSKSRLSFDMAVNSCIKMYCDLRNKIILSNWHLIVSK